jgi:hypothetical protein
MSAGKKAVFVICALSLLLAGYFAIWGIRTTRVETLQNLVARNLKTGTPSEKVIQFLNSQHLENTGLIKTDFMRIGARNYDEQLVVAAIERHTARALLWKESIEIVFVFNEQHALVRFDVFPVYSSF